MDRVKVGIRIRPLIGIEINNGAANAVQAKGGSTSHSNKTIPRTVFVNVPARKNTYDYDWVFGPNETQRTVYEEVRL